MPSPLNTIDRARTVLVDLDGCFLFGDRLAGGARDLFRLCGDRIYFVSNNSTHTPSQMAALLSDQGISIAADRILLAGAFMVELVATRHPGKQVFMVSTPAMQAHAEARGLQLDETNPELVLLCRDTGLTYARLSAAVNHLRRSLPLFVANPDRYHPGPNGCWHPETGSLLAAIQAMIPDIQPKIIGKPQRYLFDAALARSKSLPGQSIMIGDNPETALAGANRAGIPTFQVGNHPTAAAKDIHTLLRIEHALAPQLSPPAKERISMPAPSVVQSLFSAIENMGEALVLWDSADRLVHCNSNYCRLFDEPEQVRPGITFSELVEMNIRNGSVAGLVWTDNEIAGEMLTPDAYRKLRMQCHKKGEGIFQIKRQNGQWLQVRESRTRDGGVVGLYTDISDRKRTETQLAEAKHTAEEANLAKSRFLAAASHDLRQPLHAIGIFLSALNAHPLSDENRRIVSNIDACLQSTNSLFSSLLDISKLDAKVIHPERQAVQLTHLLHDLQREFKPAARQKNLELRVLPTSVVVDTDPSMLGRIVRNFVSNAVKYTDTGRVLVGVRRTGTSIRIDVCDTGIGFETCHLKRIFKEFERLHVEPGRQEGLGLGLAIAARLASLLGHRIEVQSSPRRGSRFSIRIPRVLEHPSMALPHYSPMVDDPRQALQGCQIVLVEDDRDIRLATQTLLSLWGCRIWATASAQLAIDKIRQRRWRPELIIVDYHLAAKITGKELIFQIRELLGKPLPAVIITGDTAPERLKEMDAPICPLLHKPLQPLKLRAVLQRLRTDASMI
jgi:HAD superfamily hydrolase (TIGR01450 family)